MKGGQKSGLDPTPHYLLSEPRFGSHKLYGDVYAVMIERPWHLGLLGNVI